MSCCHFDSAVKFEPIKDIIKREGLKQKCMDCNATEVYMCLKCGFVGCSRNKNKHALQHYLNNRDHVLSIKVNWATGQIPFLVWCEACDRYMTNIFKNKFPTIVSFLSQTRSASSNVQLMVPSSSGANIGVAVKVSSPLPSNVTVQVNVISQNF